MYVRIVYFSHVHVTSQSHKHTYIHNCHDGSFHFIRCFLWIYDTENYFQHFVHSPHSERAYEVPTNPLILELLVNFTLLTEAANGKTPVRTM